MPEIGTSGSMSEDGKRSVAAWPKLPRPSSTLPPILTSGLKVLPWSMPARDAQIAELAKISHEMIAHAFRVPLQLLSLGGAPFSSTETLMQFWLSTGLGFALNLTEQSFDRLFGLKGEPEEYTEFDTSTLLRTERPGREFGSRGAGRHPFAQRSAQPRRL